MQDGLMKINKLATRETCHFLLNKKMKSKNIKKKLTKVKEVFIFIFIHF